MLADSAELQSVLTKLGLGHGSIVTLSKETGCARVFQSELAAFGYRHGKLSGVGAHDDTVVAAWLVERAIALLEEILPTEPDIITIEDLGIQRVKIGPDY